MFLDKIHLVLVHAINNDVRSVSMFQYKAQFECTGSKFSEYWM